jgi:hypothetical protein
LAFGPEDKYFSPHRSQVVSVGFAELPGLVSVELPGIETRAPHFGHLSLLLIKSLACAV